MTSEPLADLRCPRCGNTQVRALSLVHASGISVGSMTGVAFGGDGGFGSAVTSSQSALSRSAAPPVELKPANAAWASGVLAVIAFSVLWILGGTPPAERNIQIAGIVVGIIIAAAGALWTMSRRAYMDETYTPALAKWKRSFLCDRCGDVFEASRPSRERTGFR